MVERHGNGSGIPEHLFRLCTGTVGVGLGLRTLDKAQVHTTRRSHYVGRLHWQRRARLVTLNSYLNIVPSGQCQYVLSLLLPILDFFCDPFAKDLY